MLAAGKRRSLLSSRYGLEIRTASSADAPGLFELLNVDDNGSTPRILAERLDALRQEQGVALLALEWGPPSGLIVLHWYRTLEAAQPIAQITTLLVSPDKRRRGIGRLLVKAAAQAARVAGCGALELLAPPERHDLNGFCQNSGFAEAGPRFMRALRKNG
jgi:aminoglycoside 6'-N-acetyltransferase I